MAIAINMLRAGFRYFDGLDRRYAVDLWHVTGITGWDYTDTDIVISLFPARGSAYPDSKLAGAILVGREIRDAWLAQDGLTQEAIVALTYDSDRRWGRAGYVESGIIGSTERIAIPNFRPVPTTGATSGTIRYDWYPLEEYRDVQRWLFPCDGSGITDVQKSGVFANVRKAYLLYGNLWILENPSIIRTGTNQTIIKYSFRATAPMPSFPASPTIAKTIPAIGRLSIYGIDGSTSIPSIIEVSATTQFPSPLDPTTGPGALPFWSARL